MSPWVVRAGTGPEFATCSFLLDFKSSRDATSNGVSPGPCSPNENVIL